MKEKAKGKGSTASFREQGTVEARGRRDGIRKKTRKNKKEQKKTRRRMRF